jgi:hypothetical protein
MDLDADRESGERLRAVAGCFRAVAYKYYVGTYEFTNAQYVEFLNAKAATDPLGLYNTSMGSGFGGITRTGRRRALFRRRRLRTARTATATRPSPRWAAIRDRAVLTAPSIRAETSGSGMKRRHRRQPFGPRPPGGSFDTGPGNPAASSRFGFFPALVNRGSGAYDAARTRPRRGSFISPSCRICAARRLRNPLQRIEILRLASGLKVALLRWR